jgi:hypothetical protein
MSRNDNRSGLPDNGAVASDETPAPIIGNPPGMPSASPEAPMFNWTTPTEFVKLPSGGRFYPQDHPLHNQAMVEIRYMTAKEEDILTSKALLKEGLALDRMLQNLLVDKTINVVDLVIGDKNALLVGARRTGYGPVYETQVTCPACNVTDEFSFDISDPEINNFEDNIENTQSISLTENNTFVMTLPMTEVVVECRLLTGADELQLAKAAERKARRTKEQSISTDTMRAYIVSVNGDASPMMKEALIQNLPARDARFLRKTYTSVVPNIDLTQVYECPNCTHTADMEVPLGIDFFWPE